MKLDNIVIGSLEYKNSLLYIFYKNNFIYYISWGKKWKMNY